MKHEEKGNLNSFLSNFKGDSLDDEIKSLTNRHLSK